MSSKITTIRNLVLLLGVYYIASLALPQVGWLVSRFVHLFAMGGTAVYIGTIVRLLVVFAAAGALLCAVVESQGRLRWALALGLLPLARYISQLMGSSQSLGLNGLGITFIASHYLIPVLGTWVGYLVDRRRRGTSTP